jgi:hypothetical protein
MDEALWDLSLSARASLQARSPVEAEALVWTVRSWWGVQGATRDTGVIAARALLQLGLRRELFLDEFSSARAVEDVVDLVAGLADTMQLLGARRYEMSLASKTLHWLLPWWIPVYDAFVCDQLGLSQNDPRSAYRGIVDWQYARAGKLLALGSDWIGNVNPRSPLRALDKYLWYAGGGSANKAVVVKSPRGRISRLVGQIRSRGGDGAS